MTHSHLNILLYAIIRPDIKSGKIKIIINLNGVPEGVSAVFPRVGENQVGFLFLRWE
jgi:hypothetical protein